VLGEAFRMLELRLRKAIALRYGLPWPRPVEPTEISLKWADRMAATAEAIHVAGWSEQDTRETLGLQYPLLEQDPLVDAGYKSDDWEPMTSDTAADAWLTALRASTL
jgi:hypothetical protein